MELKEVALTSHLKQSKNQKYILKHGFKTLDPLKWKSVISEME